MSIAGKNPSDKSIRLIELAQELDRFVQEAATKGTSLRDLERGAFDCLLKMGFTVVEQFLSLQGDGDLGETVSADDGQMLYRSSEPSSRPLRTIFGQHEFSAYVYRERAHPNTPIVFRPIDARMSLSPARWSHLLEEFTQLFAIEQAFDPAAKAFGQIFRQQLSVDTLESVNQQMGEEAGEFLLKLTPPTGEEEGELLVLTCDGKGVPMSRRMPINCGALRNALNGPETVEWRRWRVCTRWTSMFARPSRSWRLCSERHTRNLWRTHLAQNLATSE